MHLLFIYFFLVKTVFISHPISTDLNLLFMSGHNRAHSPSCPDYAKEYSLKKSCNRSTSLPFLLKCGLARELHITVGKWPGTL